MSKPFVIPYRKQEKINRKQVTARIPVTVYNRLVEVAQVNDQTVNELINEALQEKFGGRE